MHLSHPLGGARGGRPPSAAREPRYWVLDAPVFASANPAAMSQTKAGNLVSGMSSGMGFVTGSRTFRLLTTPIAASKKPDQMIHLGKRCREPAAMDTPAASSPIGREKPGPPKAYCR